MLKLTLYRALARLLRRHWIEPPRARQLRAGEEPAPLFHTIFFEARTRCNSRCAFCAASIQNETREDLVLPFDLHAKVIDELAELGYHGQIAYHINSEPLLVPNLEQYIEYARALAQGLDSDLDQWSGAQRQARRGAAGGGNR